VKFRKNCAARAHGEGGLLGWAPGIGTSCPWVTFASLRAA